MQASQLLLTREGVLTDRHEYTVHSSASCQPPRWSKLNARVVVGQLQLTALFLARDLQTKPTDLHNAYMTAEPLSTSGRPGYG